MPRDGCGLIESLIESCSSSRASSLQLLDSISANFLSIVDHVPEPSAVVKTE